jgi:hypothetical protein
MKYYISAYASSPSPKLWNPLLEGVFFKSLAQNPNVIGIEHPFLLNTTRYPIPWLKEFISDDWSVIVTALPAFMDALKEDKSVGLASSFEAGRYKALKMMEQLALYVKLINHQLGRKVVAAIHIHSAPRNLDDLIIGNKAQLRKSLLELKSIDFDGCDINLEHCDAYIPGGSNQNKSFLNLDDEIEVLSEFKSHYGLIINWGRSAIEGRSVDTPLKHIELAIRHSLLRGVFFSGVSDTSKEYGIWKDTHMPIELDPRIIKNNDGLAKLLKTTNLPSGCLLNYSELKRTLDLVYNQTDNYNLLNYLGIKLSNLDLPVSLDQALVINLAAIIMIGAASKL